MCGARGLDHQIYECIRHTSKLQFLTSNRNCVEGVEKELLEEIASSNENAVRLVVVCLLHLTNDTSLTINYSLNSNRLNSLLTEYLNRF